MDRSADSAQKGSDVLAHSEDRLPAHVGVSPENDGKSASEGGDSCEGDSKSGERLVFSGTDRDTIELAKSFWKSVTLQPPLESNLVSSNIKQRLPKAPQVQNVTRSEFTFEWQLTSSSLKFSSISKTVFSR